VISWRRVVVGRKFKGEAARPMSLAGGILRLQGRGTRMFTKGEFPGRVERRTVRVLGNEQSEAKLGTWKKGTREGDVTRECTLRILQVESHLSKIYGYTVSASNDSTNLAIRRGERKSG